MRPPSTESARSAPPARSTFTRGKKVFATSSIQASAALTTTKIRSMRETRSSARTVCASIGSPATVMYCFGRSAPMRRPTPAAGMSA